MASSLLLLLVWLIVICSALAIARSDSLLKSLIYLSVFSFCSAAIYLLLHAPDVAITEAAIGAAISTVFALVAISKIGVHASKCSKRKLAAFAILVPLTITMFFVVADMPIYSSADSATNLGSADHYLHKSYSQTAIPNIVTSVLASYRGFDTLGELNVILAAMFAVLLILPTTIKRVNNEK